MLEAAQSPNSSVLRNIEFEVDARIIVIMIGVSAERIKKKGGWEELGRKRVCA